MYKNREWIKECFFCKPYYCTAELYFILVTCNLNLIFLWLEYIAAKKYEWLKIKYKKGDLKQKQSTDQAERPLAITTWSVMLIQRWLNIP